MQPSCPGSRDLNWTGKGLKVLSGLDIFQFCWPVLLCPTSSNITATPCTLTILCVPVSRTGPGLTAGTVFRKSAEHGVSRVSFWPAQNSAHLADRRVLHVSKVARAGYLLCFTCRSTVTTAVQVACCRPTAPTFFLPKPNLHNFVMSVHEEMWAQTDDSWIKVSGAQLRLHLHNNTIQRKETSVFMYQYDEGNCSCQG
jgi:hypothetical protein